jgi:nicotinamidase-related amidase
MKSLLIIDAQNDYINPSGVCAKDTSPMDHTRTIQNIRTLITLFENNHLPITWVSMNWPVDIKDQSQVWIDQYKKELGNDAPFPVRLGSWGWQVDERLAHFKKDHHHIVDKKRSSGFFKTNLDVILKDKKVTHNYICGFFSHGCVEATARDSTMNDFYTTVVADACGYNDETLHNNALSVMASRHNVINTGAVNV